jgi:hypothetical protein
VLPTNLADKLSRLGQLIMRARSHYEIWWVYKGETRPGIIDIMNRYVDFFRFDEHAHFVALIMYLGQIFERRRKVISLPSVVDQATLEGVDARALDAARKLLDDARPIWQKTVVLRSNLFAHRSASVSYAEAFTKAQLKPDELRDLTQFGLAVVNTLAAAVQIDGFEFVSHSREDMLRLMGALGSEGHSL